MRAGKPSRFPFLRNKISAVFALSLLVTGILAANVQGAPQAVAAPGDPFSLDEPVVFVGQGDEVTQLYEARANATTGQWEFEETGSPVDFRYNALGFNRNDGYLYAVVESATAAERKVVRIGQNGVATILDFVVPGPQPWSGAFNYDDGYFYVAPANANRIQVIDVSGSTPRLVRELNPGAAAENVFDFVYADGFFWGMNGDGILRINPANGASQFFPAPESWELLSGSYGAAWVFGNGNLGFSRNDGTVYQIAVEDPASDNPTFTLVGSQPGPKSTRNDGAAIPGLPTDLSITKDGPARLNPGGKISYDITVTNNGPGVSSGWIVSDPFPEGLSNVEVTGDVVAQVINGEHKISGGRLGVNESRTFTVTSDVAENVTGCITNTAGIVANEQDPNSDNNSDSATACVKELEITKSSDASADSRPGDTITYTVTATNVGEGDFTEEDPAVVFDDLTGVLDDADYNDDATASRGDAPSYDAPLLSWVGALPAGESVDISYTATLQHGGDGEVRNVAWVPSDPENPKAPDCDPADEDGRDPGTGELCAVVDFELPRLSVTKAASESDLPAVGEEVTFTVTVTNEGPGDFTDAAPATLSDDLTNVIDDAELDEDSITANIGAASYSEPKLTWSGALAAGETAEITYSATYTGAGNQLLLNTVCVPETDTAPGSDPCATVQVPGANLTQWKSVSATDDPVVAGSELEYTLFFKNDGQAAAAVDAIDFLTHVLDDADVTVEPESDDLSVTRDGEQILITGTVQPGQTATVTYTVTVKEDGARGDDIAANFLLENDSDNPPTPPLTPECDETEDLTQCTTTPIGAIEYSKSVESDTDPVDAGSVLTYVIEISSTGTATMPVERDDVLTDVLDDATLTSEPESDTESVTVTEVSDGRFEIRGELAGGQSAKVTYSVTVNKESERGNNAANNFLVPGGDEPPNECVDGDGSCTHTPLPNLDVVKSVDPESGSTVNAGDEVTYTLEFTNQGAAAGSVDYTDVLVGVLDDAELTSDPSSDSDALSVSEVSDGQFTVTGTLGAGDTATVTYTVRVLPDGQRGDHMLGNFLIPSGETPPETCEEDSPYCTVNGIPNLTQWKSVSATDDPVVAGSELEYTLFFKNDGQAAGAVDAVDFLTHVLDDADVTVEPESDDLSVTRDGEQIVITGTVQPGQTATVTYAVTVKKDGARGDDVAANFLLKNDSDNPPTPPLTPECDETEDLTQCTTTPIGAIEYSKSVESDTDPVVAGSVLTYVIDISNTGATKMPVDRDDVLTDVLDDATLTSEPESDTESVTVTEVSDGRFEIRGELAGGQSAKVTYSVTVKEESERGNNAANNFLVPGGDEPPNECVDGDGSCTHTPLPNLDVVKSVDPESGSTVNVGDELTYTLTFDNTGKGSAAVDYTDVLVGVLDDAELTSDPSSDSDALSVSEVSDGQFTVTGTLGAGDTATVSYTVRVLPDGQRGDHVLGNFLIPSGETPPETCEDGSPYCTVNSVPSIAAWKTVDPASTTPVVGGQELTYTLHFENTGAAAGAVDMVDDLTHVLDDAEVSVEPTASDADWQVDRDGSRISISGGLAAGATTTVTYTVVVKGEGDRGDNVIANFLLSPDVETPEGPECDPDPDAPTCTVNPVGEIVVAKSVDPASGTEVADNQKLTYTLTFENTGKGSAAVDYVDHMQGVLDDADFGDITVSGNLEVTGPVDDELLISGVLEPGELATVKYTVTVKEYAEQGDHHLVNFVTSTGTEPPTECVDSNPLCTENPTLSPPDPEEPETPTTPPTTPEEPTTPDTPEDPVTPPASDEPATPEKQTPSELPRTGPSGLQTLLAIAAVAIAAGAALLSAGRQRQFVAARHGRTRLGRDN